MKQPTLAAMAVIIISQLVVLGVVGVLGFFLIAETMREADDAPITWGFVLLYTLVIAAVEFEMLKHLIQSVLKIIELRRTAGSTDDACE